MLYLSFATRPSIRKKVLHDLYRVAEESMVAYWACQKHSPPEAWKYILVLKKAYWT